MDVTIQRSGNLLQITPVIEQMQSILTYRHRSMDRSWDPVARKYVEKFVVRPVSLCTLEDDKLLATAGFTRRITTWLRERGYNYSFQDFREGELPAPDYSRLGNLLEGQDVVLAILASHDCGQIVAPTGYGKSHLIVETCKMYPTLRIAIISQAVEVVNTVHERLLRAFPQHVIGKCGDGRNDPKRITVSTVRSMLKTNPADVDLVLFDEVHTAAAEATAADLAHFRNARMFGFTASPEGRHDGAELVIEGIFGPIVHEVPYQAAQEDGLVVQIEVEVYNATGPSMSTRNSVARARTGLWRNASRNNLIAELARMHSATEQTLILTDKIEHALHLKALLPDFEVVYNSMTPEQTTKFRRMGLLRNFDKLCDSKRRAYLRKQFESGKLRKAIATGVWHKGVDFTQLEVCIRADGSGSEIQAVQIPGRLSRVHEGKRAGKLIDFNDSFDSALGSRSAKRLKSYRSRGWSITHKEAPVPQTFAKQLIS